MSKQIKQAIWAEVSLPKLVANYRRLQVAASGADVLAVVKGGAYGHGSEACAVALAQAGAEWLGVTGAVDGLAVRRMLEANGLAARILLMRGVLPKEIEAAVDAELTPVVWTLAHLDALEAFAKQGGLQAGAIAVHLEIDTGMTRQGAAPEDLPALLARFTESSLLRLEGVMTHFAAAEDVVSPQNAAQMTVFKETLEQVHCAGLHPDWIHAGNTSTVDAGAVLPALLRLARQMDARLMCRTGIGLYGYALPLARAVSQVRDALEPVLEWKTQIVAVREAEAGSLVGYNGTFTAEKRMRLALLPVGYADGLRRELSNTGEVLIAGKRVRIVGRVSMDVTIVDVTEISDVQAGDEVVILGVQGSERITADDHARIAGTISYDILCGIASRVPRCYP